jgi:DNA-binding MarR family transcriptional regulator
MINTLSGAIGRMRKAYPAFTFRQAIAFLYICENEGLTLHELAVVSRLSDQTASRAVKALAEAGLKCPAPLVELREHPADRRLILIHLSLAGAALRHEIDGDLRARRLVEAPATASVRRAASG